MFMKKLLALGIAAVLAVSSFATTVNATEIQNANETDTKGSIYNETYCDYDDDGDDDDNDDNEKGKNKHKHEWKNKYKAFKIINKLDTIIMIIDMLDLEDEAEDIDDVHPLYTGKSLGEKNGYIYLAIEKGILKADDLKNFNPNTPAKRLEATKYIIRAIGKEALALENNDKTLDYKDAKTIPTEDIGYVYLASQYDLFDDHNGQFKPFKSSTIAEIAKALEKVEDEISESNSSTVSGIFVSDDKTNKEISIKLASGLTTDYKYTNNTPVYFAGHFVPMSSIKVGDLLKLTINSSQQVVLIEIVKQAVIDVILPYTTVLYDSLPQQLQTLVDTLKLTINYKAYKYDNQLYLIATRGQKSTGGYTINIKEVHKLALGDNKYDLKLIVETSDPAEGNPVTQALTYPYHVVKIDYINSIQKIYFADANNNNLGVTAITNLNVIETIEGTISEVDAANRKIKVKAENNIISEYTIPRNTVYTINGSISTISSLVPNMSIAITKTNGVITAVTANDVVAETSGILIAVTDNNGKSLVVKIGNEYKAFAVNQDTAFIVNGTAVTLDKIAINSNIILKQVNGILKEVRTLDTITTISGIISEVNTSSRTIKVINSNNIVTEYIIPANTVITVNDSISQIAALSANMSISITKTNGTITAIEANDVITEIAATLIAVIDDNGKKLVVQIGNEFKAYSVDESTVFKANNTIISLDDIALNSKIILKHINGILKEIIVE